MDRKRPRVSIVIPAYNQAAYLGEAIQSALNQTYRDYEIIVVNDGSTDTTSEIASRYKDQIVYICQENRGLSGARNTAIRNARGEFIALLDADDVWLPEFLEKAVPLFSSYPQAAMVYSGYRYIDSQGNEIGVPTRKVVPPDLATQIFLKYGNWLVPSAVVFRRDFAIEVGLFDEELKAVEDTDLWMKLSRKGLMVGIPDDLVKYRRHGSNMTKDPSHMICALIKYFEKRYGSLDITSDTDLQKIAEYCKLFRSATERYLAFGDFDNSVKYFIQLISLDFAFSISMPVWRSFCRAPIPLEFRNDPNYAIAFEEMESTMLKFLNEIDQQLEHTKAMKYIHRKIRISAYLALAEEGRITGNSGFFWKYMFATFSLDPRVMFSRAFWGRVLRYLFDKVTNSTRICANKFFESGQEIKIY